MYRNGFWSVLVEAQIAALIGFGIKTQDAWHIYPGVWPMYHRRGDKDTIAAK
jgi:hypothetical protein